MNETALAKSLVAILCDLIAIPSPYPPGESVDICRYAAARLKKAGYKVQVLARKKGVDNVVAKLGKGNPRIVFNAHVDTVGVGDRENWKTDPFKAVVKNGHVFGLGAGNCKGSMAVQLWLAEEIARRGGPRKGEVCFTFVADEENLGPEGMSFLRDKGHVKPDALILGAQTENQMIVSERGVFWARITTKGKAAHAGNPGAGDNAIARMTRLLTAIDANLAPKIDKRIDGPMRSTMNVGMIRGGHNTNVVPASCMVEIDRRLLPKERVKGAYKELEDTLKRAGEPKGSWTCEFLTGTNGFKGSADGMAIAALAAAIKERLGRPARFLNATGVSDGRYFADDGIEIINIGPGSGVAGHAANESVPVAEMVDSAVIQLAAIEKLMGLG
ncbi:MAG: ArgE/DapE family deacylase [Alphaproteobacteria bacterium]|nr:ArgE/DapE family deacylase [Alphaproteobacteria bacterium]